MEPKRRRQDGSYTYTTPEWDAKWYWPVGTRVSIRGASGVVTKQNGVTVRVRLDDGRDTGLVSMSALTREA